jgi:hypothetical protein
VQRQKIESDVVSLFDKMATRINLPLRAMYVRANTEELSRTSVEVRCKVTVVFTNGATADGVFRYLIEDDRSFVAFKLNDDTYQNPKN